jgi:hypothetical protein
MTPYEKTLSDILVCLVKRLGGEIDLIDDDVHVSPDEIVYI